MSLNRLLVTSALLLAAASARAQEPVTHTPPVEEALAPATGQPLPNGTAPPATGLGTTTPLRQLTSVIVSAQPFRFTGQVDMDGRGGAFFADEIDDDTVLGSDDGIFAWAATYVGVFAGFGQADNRIVDVDGFANWGNPGSTVDYDTSGFIGGALIGKKFKIGGVPLRIELDGMVGKVSATSNRLDPEGLDETVQSVCCQIATARAGIEQPVGAATIFAAGGLAAARIEHSVTDIDFGPNMPPRMDPDDSFHDRSTAIGWVVGLGVESPLAEAWRVRLEGSYLDFGQSTHDVNRSGDGRCGPGMSRRPCPYTIKHQLGTVRMAIIHRFGR